MKKSLMVLMTFFTVFSFSQSTVELDMSPKEYKKTLKKLDLKVTNRGYDGGGKIWVRSSGTYKALWEAALFEMDMPIGEITSETDDVTYIDAAWIFDIGRGGYAFKVLDFSNNDKVVATINTSEKMSLYQTQGKRAEEFKMFVKVLVNELLLTIK
tara:strand:+ start:340 stop:804 length:465 start_codon:yes stop_codon:yes gene_type:complete